MIPKYYVKRWYDKLWVLDKMADDCRDREGMVMFENGRVKRPVNLDEAGNIKILVDKGAISFHRSVEKFFDPDYKEIDSYDIIIDIDFSKKDIPFIKKIQAVSQFSLKILEFLYDFGFKEEEIGIKYSGNHGIHIRLTTQNLDEDEKIFDIPVKKAFPLFAKYFLEFINSISLQIKSELGDPIYNYITIDTQVASPRHMIRAVFSINEKLPGVSYPLLYEEVEKLPEIYEKFKFPNALSLEEPSAEYVNIKSTKKLVDLLRISVIWGLFSEATESYLRSQEYQQYVKNLKKKLKKIEITPELEEEILFPPCIKNILKGLEDGRKRAVFILINFFANIGWDWERIEKKLWEWNEKNKEPLRERYIEYQLEWHKRVYSKGKKYLPPNCNNDIYYSDMVSIDGPVCQPDDLCKVIKNPLVYYLKKLKMLKKSGKKEEEIPKDLI